jgi:DNA-directed RNA polymerase subunit RPC12/RpoP
MSDPSYCRECGTRLYGDREPAAGVCGRCALPRFVRRRKRLRKKPLTYECLECGKVSTQTTMGGPRTYCPECSTRTARRHRAKARTFAG